MVDIKIVSNNYDDLGISWSIPTHALYLPRVYIQTLVALLLVSSRLITLLLSCRPRLFILEVDED